jgi:hypothetical protein
MAAVGVVIGIGASLAITRLMSSLLFGISATDPLTFAGVALLLLSSRACRLIYSRTSCHAGRPRKGVALRMISTNAPAQPPVNTPSGNP